MKKIIFLDIDDTLLTSKKTVLDKTKEAIDKYIAKGGLVVLTSGRSDLSIRKVNQEIDGSAFLIANNGALAYDLNNKKIVYGNPIAYEDLKELLKLIDDLRLGAYVNVLETRYKNIYSLDLDSPLTYDINNLEVFKNKIVFQVVITLYDYDYAMMIEKMLGNFSNLKICNQSRSLLEKKPNKNGGYYYFDICNKNTKKGNAIRAMIKYLNIPKIDTVAIGDHVNDISMFDEVELGFAMKNGYLELKEKADFITTYNNDENGVGDIIDKISNNLY